jgi:hypothetical protein
MGTQAVISIVEDGKVKFKLVAGCNGQITPKLVKLIKKHNTLAKKCKITETLEDMLLLAQNEDFGCPDCLVVMDSKRILGQEVENVGMLYRETFDKPEFNPRWENGTADYVRVIERNKK